MAIIEIETVIYGCCVHEVAESTRYVIDGRTEPQD